jgi:hypothetical protein
VFTDREIRNFFASYICIPLKFIWALIKYAGVTVIVFCSYIYREIILNHYLTHVSTKFDLLNTVTNLPSEKLKYSFKLMFVNYLQLLFRRIKIYES